MNSTTDRRAFLQSSAAMLGIAGVAIASRADSNQPASTAESEWPGFPQQDPALVKEVVGASHRNLARVKELVSAHPALAKASYDWGFGDWESALGAAAHVGNKEIAAVLIEHGARLDIFAAAMLGMTDAVLAMLKVQPALARTRGPHGISLFAHAQAGENAELVTALKAIEGAVDSVSNPVTADEMKTYLGTFTRESGGTVTVSQTRFGLAIKGGAGNDCRLVRTGAHSFHPAGAPSVRVTFTVKDNLASRIEIVEDRWFVSALRQS